MNEVQTYEERWGGPIPLFQGNDPDMIIIDEEPEPETHRCKDMPERYTVHKWNNGKEDIWTVKDIHNSNCISRIKYCPFCPYELGTIRSDTIKEEDRETIQKGEFEIIL